MKNIVKGFIFGLLISAAGTSCYYDKADQVYPATDCDTTAMTYSTDVQGVFTQYCNSCHGGTADLGGGIQLNEYTTASGLALDGLYGGTCTLLSSVLQDGGASSMPKGQSKIDDCSINIIRAWKNQGAPNN